MRVSTDDGRFGFILEPVAGDMVRFQIIVDGRSIGDDGPCIIGSAIYQLQRLKTLDDGRLGCLPDDPVAVSLALRTDEDLHDAATLSLAESLDQWLIHGYIFNGRVAILAQEYERGELAGPILVSVLDKAEYDRIFGILSPLCELGWKSLGVLELTALPSIEKKNWVSSIEETDALLVWGGDPLYLSYWMSQSGLTELLPSLQRDLVYVGVSAGSMAVAPTFGETYHKPYRGTGSPLTLEDMVFATPQGEISMNFVTAKGAGFTNFALILHANHKDRPDASFAGAEKWAAKLPVPVYAIDDQTAIKVTNDTVEVVSEGHWKLFTS